jgi:polyphosphate kinase 2 (PPK2 family)
MHAWYNDSMRARIPGRIDDDRLEVHLEAIREHEQMLSDEGLVLLKFWIHLSKAEQKKRLKAIERNPRLSWRATRDDWKAYHAYRKSYPLWETLLGETSTTTALWYVVEGTDERYRNLTVGRILLDAMRAAAKPVPPSRAKAVRHPVTPIAPSAIDNVKLIRDLDLSKKLSARAYPAQLEKWQGALARLSRHKRFAERSLVVAFEGVDAAGKGGAIRRGHRALDARQYVTVPIAADRRGADTPVPVALAKDSAARRHHAVRSILVRARTGRARRAPQCARRMAARVCRDQPVRGPIDARRRHRRQILAADQQGRTVEALPRA